MRTILFMFVISVNKATGLFFHEPSFIEIKPSEEIDGMDFGFSMGYQRSGKLVIGAPHSDLNGRVYTCSIEDLMKNNSVCGKAEIDVEHLANEFTREFSPNQQYCLGASIAATPDYFLTCAPLWMSSYKKIYPEKYENILTNSFGTCFVYNGTANRYDGLYEQHVKGPIRNRQAFSGGVGWTTLVDEKNNLILIAKLVPKGDITYVSMTNPLDPAHSISQNKQSSFANFVLGYQNVGYALASGYFFKTGVNQTLYAYSMKKNDMTGAISFLKYHKVENVLVNVKNTAIKHESINTMFGAAMLGVDLNLDGYTELLVGAPAQWDDDETYETGALHIYKGGNLKSIGDVNRMRSILGTKIGSRFGSAIASTDVDGDNFPEIIVSAPYEDFGLGAVYIISGFELNRMLLNNENVKSISLSQLVLTQRIQNKNFKSFGFSLQVIADTDENGRDELAVGCPESTRVILYRSISTVKVAVSTQLLGEQVVRIKNRNFTVRVSVVIIYSKKPNIAIGKLKVINNIIGNGVQIRKHQDNYAIDLSGMETKSVYDVTVDIDNDEPGSYKFTSRVELDTEDILKSKDFNSSLVVLSPHSKTESAPLEIERRCSGENCLPQLNMTLEWSGSNPYQLGSTKSETVTVRVKNYGNSSYARACAFLRVSGAQVERIGCPDTDGGYKCFLPVPIRRHAEYKIEMSLDMSRPTNKDEKLVIDVEFYNSSCSPQSNFTKFNLSVPLQMESDVISVNGSSHDRVITDSEVLDTKIKTVEVAHEYMIENNGESLWNNIYAIINWQYKAFIENYKISLSSTTSECVRLDKEDEVSYNCTFNLEPHSVLKIIPTIEIIEEEVEKNRADDKLNISSSLILYLPPTEAKREKTLTSVIEYRKELSVGQNKNLIILIATIVAILILALVTFALYKRRPKITSSEDNNDAPANEQVENVGIEVVDEPLNSQAEGGSDQAGLITKCEAEIH